VFHFVDRILELDPGRSVVAVRHVGPDEPFVDDGQLRACIVGEALGQAGAFAVMCANDFSLRPVAGMARDVSFQQPVAVGDELRLETTIDSITDTAIAYHAVATVRGESVLAIGEGLGPLMPVSEFEDPAEVRRRFERIRSGADPARDGAERSAWLGFDEIRSWEPGRSAVAAKRIDGAWPFFRDHFPRKPVLPMTLLLECLLDLGAKLLADGGAQLRPVSIRRVKMNRFVEPGSELVARVEVGERSVGFRCEVAGERVCIAEVHYA
jgi:3-hydroxymyristoyl/3-hydroxydecanoyl-(acyl carrier protein) dehydratase